MCEEYWRGCVSNRKKSNFNFKNQISTSKIGVKFYFVYNCIMFKIVSLYFMWMCEYTSYLLTQRQRAEFSIHISKKYLYISRKIIDRNRRNGFCSFLPMNRNLNRHDSASYDASSPSHIMTVVWNSHAYLCDDVNTIMCDIMLN